MIIAGMMFRPIRLTGTHHHDVSDWAPIGDFAARYLAARHTWPIISNGVVLKPAGR